MKSIVLCADDFAYNSAISDSILILIQQQRISATSCMTNMPQWPKAAAALKNFDGEIDIGLHFNLTEGNSLSPNGQALFMPLSKLLLKATLRNLNFQKIYEEFCAQLEAFTDHFGRLPDFIDGHQHIHHLPLIRSALLKAYSNYFPDKQAYIRISSNKPSKLLAQTFHCPKTLIISATGALTFKNQLERLEIPHNQSFSGAHNFKSGRTYARLFSVFMKEVDEHGVIMCHPANRSDPKTDRIAAARQQEFDFLMSNAFAEILDSIQIARF